jgi:hypothetical protein
LVTQSIKMAIITIQVTDNKALKLIQDLADLNIIQIVKDATIVKKKDTLASESNAIPQWQKKILDQRIANLEEDKKEALDFDDALKSISSELGL